MKIILKNNEKSAIYEQISSQIKDAIISGQLNSGDQLPSIRMLAKDLGVSVITTKRAYDELEKENFIESFQGRGSFVASQDTELMMEKRLSIVEQQLTQVLNEAKLLGLTRQDIYQMIDLLMDN